MPEREKIPEPPKRRGFKEYSLFKKILVVTFSTVFVIVFVTVVVATHVYYDYIEYLLKWSRDILLIVVIAALLILFVIDYLRKKKRIKHLEKILREHNISFRAD